MLRDCPPSDLNCHFCHSSIIQKFICAGVICPLLGGLLCLFSFALYRLSVHVLFSACFLRGSIIEKGVFCIQKVSSFCTHTWWMFSLNFNLESLLKNLNALVHHYSIFFSFSFAANNTLPHTGYVLKTFMLVHSPGDPGSRGCIPWWSSCL